MTKGKGNGSEMEGEELVMCKLWAHHKSSRGFPRSVT